MNLFYLVIVLFSMLSSCQKNGASEMKAPVLLLTAKAWQLTSYGYDENRNGKIDSFEELVKDCEKDNTYLFNKNGSGYYYDNAVSCGNGIDEIIFNWKLINRYNEIDFLFGKAVIERLNENEFVIYHDVEDSIGNQSRFFTILKH